MCTIVLLVIWRRAQMHSHYFNMKKTWLNELVLAVGVGVPQLVCVELRVAKDLHSTEDCECLVMLHTAETHDINQNKVHFAFLIVSNALGATHNHTSLQAVERHRTTEAIS
jgi:hypothetical protein